MLPMKMNSFNYIVNLTPELELKIRKIPFLNIDAYRIPSPYVRYKTLEKDYNHSYVWNEEGEILGYFLVYSDPDKKLYHLYKQVTSPFGRGKGIGSAFIEKLTTEIPGDSLVYLYIWDKQVDSIDFFERKGFQIQDQIVYRELIFYHMLSKASNIQAHIRLGKEKESNEIAELGKMRHDARKNVQLLLDMINMLSIDNSSKIIEDINRETTALINLLNSFGDRIEPNHEINLKDLIMERVIPFIEVSGVPCEINVSMKTQSSEVVAHYVDVGRALINLVSNSLDAIRKADRKGVIGIGFREKDDQIILEIKDNGVGIKQDRLKLNKDKIPLFVGKSTKNNITGEGLGTKQVFATFGPDNIKVESKYGSYTKWIVRLQKSIEKQPRVMSSLEARYYSFQNQRETIQIDASSNRHEIIRFIQHTRQMEFLCYDLIFQFSKYNNIRDIYRNILAFRYGGKDFEFLRGELYNCRVDTPELCNWLLDTVLSIKENEKLLTLYVPFDDFAGILLSSYGQPQNYTIIFTFDPRSGRFLCADRKLAEHLDFVPYLNRPKNLLLRGELCDDLSNLSSPIMLGVWNIDSEKDLLAKLKLIRKGAVKLIKMGVSGKKRLTFYHTTYNSCSQEIDTFKSVTLENMAEVKNNELTDFMINSDEELKGLAFAD